MDFKISENIGLYNTRVKHYPNADGEYQVAQIMTASKPLFNPHGLEEVGKNPRSGMFSVDECETFTEEKDAEGGTRRGAQRARSRLFDIAMCNHDLDMMLTLTYNKEQIDRYSYDAIIKKMNTWLDNRVRRNALKYVLVPERHKDGAIHMHGLANAEALKLVDSGHKHKGRKVYNIKDFAYGFTTAVKLDGGRENAVKYILKYISKGSELIGGRYVLSGGDLAKPLYTYANTDFGDAVGFEHRPCNGLVLKIDNNATF